MIVSMLPNIEFCHWLNIWHASNSNSTCTWKLQVIYMERHFLAEKSW